MIVEKHPNYYTEKSAYFRHFIILPIEQQKHVTIILPICKSKQGKPQYLVMFGVGRIISVDFYLVGSFIREL